MENVTANSTGASSVPPVVEKVADAVAVLANNAASQNAASPEVIAPAAQLVASVVKTEQGLEATQALAQQAVTPEAGEPKKVAEAVSKVVDSIVANPAPAPAPAAAPAKK